MLPPTRDAFDTCHVGVVLRTLLAIEAALAVAALFGSASWADWLGRVAVLTGAGFPATVGWLLLACASRRLLAALPGAAQVALAVGSGAVAGWAGGWLMQAVGFAAPAWSLWAGSAAAGALAAAMVTAWLFSRAQARSPADDRARLSDLQARIRPHFLFNTLNSAIALVRTDPAQAERLLEDLSDLFRAALDDAHELAPLSDEIELAKRYLAIEQARFGDRLRVRWSIEPHALGTLLPRLLLQPLLENAVRHGVEPSEGGADVEVHAWRRGSRVGIEVGNTMPAGEGERGHGLGLPSVRDRIALLHDVQARVEVQRKDGWFRVRIELPAPAASQGLS